MPRYLYLLRHAQSADKQIGHTDKERTLTATGLAEAKAVGKFLKEKPLIPDLIISSSAFRAKTTAQTVAKGLQLSPEAIVIRDDLYEATVRDFTDVTIHNSHEVERLMVVGHNPAISLFFNHLTQENNRGLLPSELIILKFECTQWKDIPNEKAELIERFHPTA